MTQEQIRRLLAGYSTDNLTAEERRVLFEAALEDQELFNALQDEDELRELLADPISCQQVRAALQTGRPGFWSRRWLFGVAVPAAVAVIVIAVMYRPNPAGRVLPTPAPAAVAAAPELNRSLRAESARAPRPAPEAKVKKQIPEPERIVAQAPTPLPPPVPERAIAPPPAPSAEARLARPVPTAAPLASPMMARFGTAPPAMPEPVRRQFAAGFSASVPRYQGPLVQYSLVRSGAAGQQIQVAATPEITGYLALYQVDASGNSKRIYPTGELAVRVFANQKIQVPAEPVEISEAGAGLQLVLVPTPAAAGIAGGFVSGEAALKTAPFTPLVVDIPIGPK